MTDTPRDPAADQANDSAASNPTAIDSAPDVRLDAEEAEFSNDHPLASPNELAGTAGAGLDLEFALRDLADDSDSAEPSLQSDAQGAEPMLERDAQGAASGIAYEEDTLPLEGN